MNFIDLLAVFAIPAALVLVGIEFVAARGRRDELYTAGDSWASIGCLVGSRLIITFWITVEVAIYRWLYDHALFPMHQGGWGIYVAAVFAVDFAFYWYHRIHHKVPLLWGVHAVHHSSNEMNLVVGLRQPWIPFTLTPFFVPLALIGFPPETIVLGALINMMYTFPLHTRFVERLPKPVAWLLNTPATHRVHHGTNPQYLDKNFGGIVLIWDRLFGTYEPEVEPVVFGVTPRVDSYNPIELNTMVYRDLWRNRRRRRSTSPPPTPPEAVSVSVEA